MIAKKSPQILETRTFRGTHVMIKYMAINIHIKTIKIFMTLHIGINTRDRILNMLQLSGRFLAIRILILL